MDAGQLILIVEDSPEDRAAFRRFLDQSAGGYRYAEAADGAEGLRACREAAPDCLLLDYDLPDLNGVEFIDRLADAAGSLPCPIIMLTGRGNERVAVEAIKRGAADYVVKGHFTGDDLCHCVADALERFAARAGVERRRAELEHRNREARDASRPRERLVLVIDDSPEDREALARHLRKDANHAYRVLESSTAAEGLAACETQGPDCVLLDYSLPDADGLEFLRELSGGGVATPCPVVMLTGCGDEVLAVKALKLGALDYLVKGRYTPEVLRRTVDRAIEEVALRRAREGQRVRVLERLAEEARRRADQLAEHDRRKDEFLATLAHELRNPLAPLRNITRALELAGPDPVRVAEALGVIGRQVGQMARLIDDLLDVGRISRGKIELRRAPVALADVLAQAVETVRPAANAAGHALRVDLPGESLLLDADAARVSQVLSNLLANAVKYTDPGGGVNVTAARDGAWARVSVADTGVGLAAEDLCRVFEPFAQVGGERARHLRGGLGIGLSLVKSLVELHGGTAEAHSDGPGRGSTFTVRLPLKAGMRDEGGRMKGRPEQEDGVASSLLPSSLIPQPSSLPRRRVLVVDDLVDSGESLGDLLRLYGQEVVVVHDGAAALRTAEDFRPDVALVDIGMPVMDGLEVARRMRAGASPARLVAVTGYGQDSDRRRSREAGFDAHLVKPVDPDELCALLARL